MAFFDIAREPRTTILLVDDQRANLIALRAILEPLDQNIIEAGSGEDALRQLLAQEMSVILLDIQMPGLDGFEVARLIREREKNKRTPIIFLTAFEDHRFTVPEAYSLGAIDYLVKPIVPDILLAKVALFVELFQKAELLRRLGYEEREKGQEIEARKAAILETALDGIITIDHESRIVEFNPAAESTFGHRKADVLGRSMPDVIMPPEVRDAYTRGLARYLETGEGPLLRRRIEMLGMSADTSTFPIELSIVPHGSSSTPLFTAYVRDITDRKEAEQLLHTAVLREQERAEQLREADRRKDEFLAMLAHELRNPLAAVANSLQICRTPGIESRDLGWAHDVMNRQVSQLTRLIDDLLDVSRITQGKIQLRREIVSLERVIERAVDAVARQMERKQQSFQLILPDNGPLWVKVDPARMEQVLTNLLANATKFTHDGGEIELCAQQDGSQAVVDVRDNGIGIAAEMLPQLFELFAQADRSLDRSHGGLGIGLTLVKTLIEMHGGTVTAASEGDGRGAVFTLRLPLVEAPAREVTEKELPLASPSKRVLVVDDNYDAALSLAMILKTHGHVTQFVTTGEAALELAEGFRPEIVLLDIGLPEMDGFEVARQIRQSSRENDPLLVAITGYGQPQDRARSEAAGFDHHLVKPVDLSELLHLCSLAGDINSTAIAANNSTDPI
jgi:PAS domain S-box-containing protein